MSDAHYQRQSDGKRIYTLLLFIGKIKHLHISKKILYERITALDPAAPLYLKWSYDAIRMSDAPFVDIIHTNGERLGESWAR